MTTPAHVWLAFSLLCTALAGFFLVIYDGATAFTCAIAGIGFLYVEHAHRRPV